MLLAESLGLFSNLNLVIEHKTEKFDLWDVILRIHFYKVCPENLCKSVTGSPRLPLREWQRDWLVVRTRHFGFSL